MSFRFEEHQVLRVLQESVEDERQRNRQRLLREQESDQCERPVARV